MCENHPYCSKNFWSPCIRPEICRALFRLKKGFFGGSPGSWTLQSKGIHPKKWHQLNGLETESDHISFSYSEYTVSGLTLALNLLVVSVWAIRTRWIFFSHARSSWWNTHCWSTRGHKQDNVNIHYMNIYEQNSFLLSFYLHVNKFHSLYRHARSRFFVSVGPSPRRWWPPAWRREERHWNELKAQLMKKGKLLLPNRGSGMTNT